MPSRQSPPSSLTLTRAISTDGQTITHDRPELGTRLPIVGLVAAYRFQRLRLSMRLGSLPGHRMLPMASNEVTMPKRASSSSMGLLCDLLIVEPGDLAKTTLEELVGIARIHDVPLIWLGEPPVAQRLATATLPGGMIPPQSSIEQIDRTLRAAEVGLNVIHPDFAHVVDQTEIDVEDELLKNDAPTLSPREQEVLTHVANGLPNKAIARKLGITDHTVKFHVSSVLTKLEAASRTEAVAIATRRGMIAE